jgi:ubiquitin fusion degradation protein 1
METKPEGPGISIIDTDLEVDFETPVGYVEPPRKAPAPIPTMADKLKIDLGGTTLASQDASRPVSSMSVRTQGSGDGALESFTGVGHSLSGRKVKGKGLAKKIEEVDSSSKINRHS